LQNIVSFKGSFAKHNSAGVRHNNMIVIMSYPGSGGSSRVDVVDSLYISRLLEIYIYVSFAK